MSESYEEWSARLEAIRERTNRGEVPPSVEEARVALGRVLGVDLSIERDDDAGGYDFHAGYARLAFVSDYFVLDAEEPGGA